VESILLGRFGLATIRDTKRNRASAGSVAVCGLEREKHLRAAKLGRKRRKIKMIFGGTGTDLHVRLKLLAAAWQPFVCVLCILIPHINLQTVSTFSLVTCPRHFMYF
jgi:hypothetical protein